MRSLLLTLLVLISCDPVRVEPLEVAMLERMEVPSVLAQSEATVTESPKAEAPAQVSPYAGWDKWCEPAYLRPCKTKKDCETLPHPANKAMKCVRPYWARDPQDRVCSPGYSNRAERDHQRARIRELVRLQYSGEVGCEGWRCSQSKVRGDRIAALLTLVAHRETTLRPWKRHRLNGDIRWAAKAWERTAKIYGHERVDGRLRLRRTGNPHYRHDWRWRFGLGLYGMNASLFTRTWDAAAPPEILCRDIEATAAYLRSTRKAWRKLSGGINCDGKPGREWHGFGGSPTWYDVHRYASGGKLCPGKKRGAFERRARKAGLDPYGKVSLADLGTPIPRETQNEVALKRRVELDAFSMQWRLERAL